MNYYDTIKRLLPATTPEIAAELETSVRQVNARLQYYKRLGLIKHNDRLAPKTSRGPGRRAKFWVLA